MKKYIQLTQNELDLIKPVQFLIKNRNGIINHHRSSFNFILNLPKLQLNKIFYDCYRQNIENYIHYLCVMDTKIQKLIADFSAFCQQNTDEILKKYLKSKTAQLFGEDSTESVISINWKDELIEAYEKIKAQDSTRARLTALSEEIITCFQKTVKSKDLQIQMLNNELTITKSCLQQQRIQTLKLQKDHQHMIEKQKLNTIRALQKLQYKEYEYRELEEKISDYEQQIQEIKSAEYQNMINSIKEEQIMNSQALNLYKENTLLKYQLKEETAIKNQISKHVKALAEQVEMWKLKYHNARRYINNRIDSKKQLSKHAQTVSRAEIKHHQQNTINLIEFKDDFSFKDSIENDNNSIIVHNNVPSFLDLESHSDFLYDGSESPDRCLMERDILNLTDRDRSTQSRNITKHLIRSKKRYIADKENISQNTWDYQEFQQYHNDHKVSTFGSKCQQVTQKNITSNCSISKYVPSPRAFGTQQRSSLLSKHRRIKSSLCGKSIQEFQEYESNHHFIVNSEKLQESMFEDEDEEIDPLEEEKSESNNDLQDESSILAYDVNEIVINEELITSHKSRLPKEQKTPQMFSNIEAKMINSVQVMAIEPSNQMSFQKKTSETLKVENSLSPGIPLDPYYTFFSLTAQCVKLNAKNFNRAISVYFNLQEEYSNVIKKTIPINKWYNYINDQIQTALKYTC